jgi:hypothetical protein
VSTSTAALNVAGCKVISGIIRASSAAAYAQYQMQLSIDGGEFFSVGSPVTATSAPVLVSVPAGSGANFARMIVSTGGTTQVGSYAAIYATG